MSQVYPNEKKDDAEFFNGEWIRRASEDEIAMEKGHLAGHILVWYQLNLSCLEPLKEDDVRKAFKHFYRKVPIMNMCYGDHNGEMWLRKATNPDVDFKVLHGLSLEEVRESLRRYRYNSNTGPLFCGRLLQDAKDTDEGFTDVEPSFPYKCNVFFGFHHGLTDGTSNMYMMGFFVSILNDILANRPIDDDKPFGYFATTEVTDRMVLEKMAMLEKNLELQKVISREMNMKNDVGPLIVTAFPIPNKEHGNMTFVRYLDENISTRFIQRCRKEGVTVNSAITAISNMAVMDILIKQGVVQDSYNIRNYHAVNLRRYWKSDEPDSKPLGQHMGYPLAQYTDTPSNVHDDFWTYAKKLGDKMKDDVATCRVLVDKAYCKLYSQSTADTGKTSLGERSCYRCDFITSGMGDITSMVTGGGEHFKVTHLARGSTFHKGDYAILVNSHTFQGRMMITFDYSILAVLDSVAENIFSKIVEGLYEVTG